MFFMISGYLMFKKDRIDYRYSFKKALSYVRLIISWNIILAIPISLIKHKFVNPFMESLRNVFQQGYLWHFWYLGAMLITLLVLPIVHTLLKRYFYLHVAAMIILFISCLVMTSLSWKAGFPNQSFVPQALRIWVFGFYFLFGGFMAGRSTHDKRSVIILSVIFVILTYVSNMGQKHLGNYVYQNRMAENFYDEATVLLWCMVFFVLILGINIVIPSGPVEGFARLSLGVYILHPLVLRGLEVLGSPENTFYMIIRWTVSVTASALATYIALKIPYVKKLFEL